MPQPSPLLIVHNDRLHAECLAGELASSEWVSSIDLTAGSERAIECVRQHPATVVLIDWGLPLSDVLNLVTELAATTPPKRLFLFGRIHGSEPIRRCLEAGLTRHALADEPVNHLRTRIEQALADEVVPPPRPATPAPTPAREPGSLGLTLREWEVLELIAQGFRNKDIARRLHLSVHTVKNHVHHILEKLQAPGRYAAVQRAFGDFWYRYTRPAHPAP